MAEVPFKMNQQNVSKAIMIYCEAWDGKTKFTKEQEKMYRQLQSNGQKTAAVGDAKPLRTTKILDSR